MLHYIRSPGVPEAAGRQGRQVRGGPGRGPREARAPSGRPGRARGADLVEQPLGSTMPGGRAAWPAAGLLRRPPGRLPRLAARLAAQAPWLPGFLVGSLECLGSELFIRPTGLSACGLGAIAGAK